MNAPARLLSVTIDASYGDKSVLSGLSLEMQPGEIVGLVGHSGSGKSTLALAILRLLDRKGGSVTGSMKLAGRELMELSEADMRRIRGNAIAYVPQSAISSLNPALTIGSQMREAWAAHGKGTRQQREARIRDVLRAVSLPEVEEILGRKSSQLSVGQGQRTLIAMAILHSPSLLIADEPTSALDMITQSEVLELIARLNRELGIAVLYISHDLLAVSSLCHKVAILHEGKIVETGPVRAIFADPQHPFTKQLVQAIPSLPEEAT